MVGFLAITFSSVWIEVKGDRALLWVQSFPPRFRSPDQSLHYLRRAFRPRQPLKDRLGDVGAVAVESSEGLAPD